MPPRKAGGSKSAALAAPRIVPARIEIPLLSKPVYVPGAGPRSAPISLTPARDSTAYILDKYVLPKLSECGPKDRRLVYYLVGFRDLPVVRILIPCHKAQEYVDPATIEEWESEQHNKLMDERQRLQEEAAKKRKKVGRPPKTTYGPAELDYSKPSPHGTVTTTTPTGPEDHALMLDTQLTGPSLSTPQKRPRPSLDQIDRLDEIEQPATGPTRPNTKSNAKTKTQTQTSTSTGTASSLTSSNSSVFNRPSVREQEAIRRQLFHTATKHRLSPRYSPSINQDHQDLDTNSATMPRSGRPGVKTSANAGHQQPYIPKSRPHASAGASTSADEPVDRATSSVSSDEPANQPVAQPVAQPVTQPVTMPAPSVSSSGGRQTRSATRQLRSRPSTSGSASVDSPSGGARTGMPQIHPDWAQIMKFSNKVMDVMDTLAPSSHIQPAAGNATAAASGSNAKPTKHVTPSWGGDRFPLVLPSIEPTPTDLAAPGPARPQKGKKRSPKDAADDEANAKKKQKTSKAKPKKAEESSEEESWSVKHLLRDEIRYVDGRRCLHYLVQWTGNYEPTWEPASNIIDKELVRVYKAQKKAGTLPPLPNAISSAVNDAFRGDMTEDQLVREDEEEEEDEILQVTEA